MNIGESLPGNVQHYPGKLAIVDACRTVTYKELDGRTNRLANYLFRQGIVKSDGVSIFPEEIEDALLKHRDVAHAGVLGFKSEAWGEAVKAFVVLRSDTECSADTLITFCKQSLAPYKAPKVIEFLPSLPRTGPGKIDRHQLAVLDRIQ